MVQPSRPGGTINSTTTADVNVNVNNGSYTDLLRHRILAEELYSFSSTGDGKPGGDGGQWPSNARGGNGFDRAEQVNLIGTEHADPGLVAELQRRLWDRVFDGIADPWPSCPTNYTVVDAVVDAVVDTVADREFESTTATNITGVSGRPVSAGVVARVATSIAVALVAIGVIH